MVSRRLLFPHKNAANLEYVSDSNQLGPAVFRQTA